MVLPTKGKTGMDNQTPSIYPKFSANIRLLQSPTLLTWSITTLYEDTQDALEARIARWERRLKKFDAPYLIERT
jgi:hypothetical protein